MVNCVNKKTIKKRLQLKFVSHFKMNASKANISIAPYYPLELSYAPQPQSTDRVEQIFMLCIIFLLVLLVLLKHFVSRQYLQRHLNRAQSV